MDTDTTTDEKTTADVVINLTTGHEDAEKVLLAFLVATAAQAKGREVTIFATKEAARLGIPGYGEAIEVAGAPPVERLMRQFEEAGGEMLVCPICFDGRRLDAGRLAPYAQIGGATPLMDRIGPGTAVFSF
jgi:predicted peroxiredoxin